MEGCVHGAERRGGRAANLRCVVTLPGAVHVRLFTLNVCAIYACRPAIIAGAAYAGAAIKRVVCSLTDLEGACCH